ncbi:MAG: NCS1 family nucleobase:cation symporter-1 [Anaerovoracaceae bacterium]|jgi:NCS1 family nucleobase:cation symporter-1
MANYTQVERGGLFELTTEARAELASSKYYNDDLAPTSVSQRTWTTYNISMLWVGMSICIPSLSLASGLIGMGVSPWLSVINVALGNLIILIPIQLNSQIGTKYGVPFPLFARLTFGIKGAQLPALLRAITACGWCAVQAWVGGGAVAAIIGCFAHKFLDPAWTINLPSWGGMQTTSAGTFVGYIVFMLFIVWVAYNGIENIKWVQNIGGPILIVVMVALLFYSAHMANEAGYTFAETMNQGNDMALINAKGGFALVYMTGLMGNIAFWATMALNIPDFSRYARSQKDQFAGQLIGMPAPMFFCAFVGAFFAQATKLAKGTPSFNPTDVFYFLDNKVIVIISAVGVIMATITTCVAANVVAPANGISNISPKHISYKKGVIITVCIAFFILQAWWIYGSGNAYFNWMNAYGTILAPIAAIFIADYFICKKQRINMAELFKGKDSIYWYTGGINWAGFVAWIVSFILPLMIYFGFKGGFWQFINSINYIWSFVLGFVIYLILMKTGLAGKSYVTEAEHEEFTQRV